MDLPKRAQSRGAAFFARVHAIARTALPRGAVVLSIVMFGGYAMGLLRNKMLAHTFGAGPELDAYNAAFVLPELALDVLVAGGLIAPFVPLFIGLRDQSEETARAFGRTILTLSVAVMVAAATILFIFAPQTASIIVPDWTGAQRDLYIGLFRVMCVTPVIFAASIVLGEILVAERRFLLYGLAPLMYSGGIAAGAFLLSDRIGIYGAAVGAVAGAIAHLSIRVVGIYRTKFRPRPSFNLRVKGLGEFLRLMAPKMVSHPIQPIMFLYFTTLASRLGSGSVSSYNFARDFQGLPVSLFGVAFAVAAFPALSAAAAAGDRREFGRVFRTNLATIAVLTTMAALGLFLVGGTAIRVLLGGGAFDATDIAQTTLVLTVFTASIPLESMTELMARAIYATRNTILPTVAAIAGFIVTVLSAGALAPKIGLAAIPAGYSIGMGVKLAILAVVLVPRMARIGAAERRLERAALGLEPAGLRLEPASRRLPGLRRRVPARRHLAVLALGIVVLSAGTVYAAVQALQGASIGTQPQVTPWARGATPTAGPSESVARPTQSVVGPTESGASATGGSPEPGGTYASGPTPTPGPFAMDLYKEGDFVGEFKDTWCVPAAMQTQMNIMDPEPDVSRAQQARLFDLAVSIAGSSRGGTEPEGWAKGLTALQYGNYEVGAKPTLEAAVHAVVKQIRLTNRPAGLVVWRGYHSWVVSGFTATADPALTDDFTVTGLYIEDVWYNRRSTLWSQSRGGYSRPPDSLVPYSALGEDFIKWHQAKYYAGKEGQFVYIIPVE